MAFSIRWDTDKLNIDLKALGEKMDQAVHDGLYKVGSAVARDVMRVAPVKTGAYRHTIRTEPARRWQNGWVVEMGSPMPYGNRLEYGFHDKDKLGRQYNQVARPHWKPTLESKTEEYQNTLAASLRAVLEL